MPALFDRFDPYAYLAAQENRGASAANPAKAKIAFATFATCAGCDPSSASSASPALPPEWQAGITRLQAMPPPDGVPAARWRRFLDDARRVQDQGWLARAASMGWTTEDLFGVDPVRPRERIEMMGLIWLIDGAQIVALAADRAAIRMATGPVQMFYRSVHQQGVPAWQLADD